MRFPASNMLFSASMFHHRNRQVLYWDNFPISFVHPGLFFLTGTPTGNDDSDVGYSLPSELGHGNVAGAIGYWINKNRPGSSGSMFYLLLQDQPNLDEQYTAFGKVIEGLDVASTLTALDKIISITIVEQ